MPGGTGGTGEGSPFQTIANPAESKCRRPAQKRVRGAATTKPKMEGRKKEAKICGWYNSIVHFARCGRRLGRSNGVFADTWTTIDTSGHFGGETFSLKLQPLQDEVPPQQLLRVWSHRLVDSVSDVGVDINHAAENTQLGCYRTLRGAISLAHLLGENVSRLLTLNTAFGNTLPFEI